MDEAYRTMLFTRDVPPRLIWARFPQDWSSNHRPHDLGSKSLDDLSPHSGFAKISHLLFLFKDKHLSLVE
jgi:hypothetical protein